MIFGYFLTVTQTPQKVTEFLTGLGLGRYGVLALIMVMYLVLGCLMDAMAMIILTVPIIFPVISHLGFDPIWFGVIIVMTVELGLIHPPVGMNVFVIKSVVKDVSFATIFNGVMPFVVTDLIRLVILIAFPMLATWLPQRMMALGEGAHGSRLRDQIRLHLTARIGERRPRPAISATASGGSFRSSAARSRARASTARSFPFGADFQIIRPNELDRTRGQIRLRNGRRRGRLYREHGHPLRPEANCSTGSPRGETVDPALIYFRSVPQFETGAEKYRWLMENLFVGVGAPPSRSSSSIDVHQVL